MATAGVLVTALAGAGVLAAGLFSGAGVPGTGGAAGDVFAATGGRATVDSFTGEAAASGLATISVITQIL